MRHSRLICDFFSERRFELIFFAGGLAHGFIPIRRKQVLGDFTNTTLAVIMHSPVQQRLEISNRFSEHPKRDAKLDFAQRYCCQYADLVISPSQLLFDWAHERSWTMAENRKVLPYLPENPAETMRGLKDGPMDRDAGHDQAEAPKAWIDCAQETPQARARGGKRPKRADLGMHPLLQYGPISGSGH